MKQARQWAYVLLAVATFVLYASAIRGPGVQVLFAFLSFGAGAFLATLVHELGHACAAWACGWKVVEIVVGPVGLQLPNANLVRMRARPDTRGHVASVPRRAAVNTPRRWITLVAAGPVGCLVLAGLCFAVAPAVARAADGRDILPSHLAVGFGLQLVVSGLFSLLPASGKRANDLALIRQGRAFAREGMPMPAIAWLNQLLASHVRLRDLPAWMIAAARSGSDAERLAQTLDVIEIGRALDAQDVDVAAARALIDRHRDRYGAGEWLDLCDACLAAMWEGDGRRARALLPPEPIEDFLRPLRHAAFAATAARLGQTDTARIRLQAMRDAKKAQSPFRDLTFRDIGRRIEDLIRAIERDGSQAARSSAGPPASTKRLSQ